MLPLYHSHGAPHQHHPQQPVPHLFASPSAGPSIARRQSSASSSGYSEEHIMPRQDARVAQQRTDDGERFMDAAGEEERAGSNFGQPLRPGGNQPDRAGELPSSGFQRGPYSLSQVGQPGLYPSPRSPGPTVSHNVKVNPNAITTPPRERLPGSSSMSSMSGTMSGRRAPAPAALDLSPRAERQVTDSARRGDRYGGMGMGGLGLGPPPVEMGSSGVRAVTDTQVDRSGIPRVPRPLPAVPQQSRSTTLDYRVPPPPTSAPLPHSTSSPPATMSSFRSPGPFAHGPPQQQRGYAISHSSQYIPSSPSMPMAVPLSAVGNGPSIGRRTSSATVDHLSAQVESDSTRPSIDSYYLRSSSYAQTALLPSKQPFPEEDSPASPERLDPETLDRRTLIGTGELATPRWTSSTTHQHLRTPSVPATFGISPPTPGQPEGIQRVIAPGRDWTARESGLGLGVGVMEGVQEESSQRDQTHTQRHRAMSEAESSPRPARQPSREFNTIRAAPVSRPSFPERNSSITIGSLADFMFDSNIGAALAASLSLDDEDDRAASPVRSAPPPPPPKSDVPPPQPAHSATYGAPHHRASHSYSGGPISRMPMPSGSTGSYQGGAPFNAIPPQPFSSAASLAGGSNAQNAPPTSPPSAPPPASASFGSPGSARQRIYARRAERQSALYASQAFPQPAAYAPPAHAQQSIYDAQNLPPRTSSKLSPPNSADSQTFSHWSSRDSRKTPPATSREREPPSARSRQSPSATHHDILKHFAPKDFSHLPPSPSSASINQFLRGSGSVNNFAAVGTPPTTASAAGSQSYFPPSTSSGSGKGGLQRSESQKLRSVASSSSKNGWEGREVDSGTADVLRKLDGLSSTSGKGKPKSKMSAGPGTSAVSSRPGTPPPSKSRGSAPPTEKASRRRSAGSTKSGEAERGDSPLNAWVDLTEDIPALPLPSRGRAFGANGSVPPSEALPLPQEKRESSSSTSYVGTPTSRDSQSLPTTSTTPSSTSGQKPEKAGRRASESSEISTLSDTPQHANGSYEKVGEVAVPPVPPIPKGYMSMRQGLSTTAAPPTAYVPLRPVSPEGFPDIPSDFGVRPGMPLSAPSTSSADGSTRKMNKKWSFSSALNLRLHPSPKESSSSLSPPMPQIEQSEYPLSPATPWSEINQGDLPSPPVLNRFESSDSATALSSRQESRSNQSVTPVATSLAPAKGTKDSKRLTPSSIPFFRRASSSSIQSKVSPSQGSTPPGGAVPVPETPKSMSATSGSPVKASSTDFAPAQTTTKIPPASATKKSMLGMHLPSMLRGSASKRGLSQQIVPGGSQVPTVETQIVEVKAEPVGETASVGWRGRSRGKTLSISAPIQRKVSAPPEMGGSSGTNVLKPKASVDGSLKHRSSVSSNHSESTVNGGTALQTSKSGLPAIAGSPHIRPVGSTSSLRAGDRGPPSATPTKIPRMTSRSDASPAHGNMPPPALPHTQMLGTNRGSQPVAGAPSKTMSTAASSSDLARTAISEFGSMGLLASPRHTTYVSSESHRSRLLAPMSTRQETKRIFAKPVEAPMKRDLPPNVPASRRHLPLPPSTSSSSATAMTASALAKRASRDFRPANSRRGSKDSPSDKDSDSASGTAGTAGTMKPSKSLHAKLTVPTVSANAARIPSSSSVGAPGASFKKGSLVPESTSASVSPADGEDEEGLADAEMMAYVNRRKARKAAGGGKKDDLADIEEFPEDVLPAQPVSQRAFVTKNLAAMSEHERKEVLDFDKIYFVPTQRVNRPAQGGGAIYNHGYDDERGDYLVVEGDHLCYRYEVIGILGKGSFGQVVQCRDHMTGVSVAVKIIRNKKRFHAQALVEVKILQQIVEWDPEDNHYMVRMTDHFYFRQHLCIVTELLSINLYELIKANQFAGFSTVLIRRFTTQILASLQLMRSRRVVHCDLKPENILLCHPCRSGIKVIDFGSSCLETEKVYTYIQSRFYRSPEVILGMNYAMAIDMWSVGCILAELYTGVPIFPGENEHEQLACIMEVLGVPDKYLVNQASRRKVFFDATGAPRPFVNAKGKRRRPGSKTLAQILKCDDDLFVDFIVKCLAWDPDKRLKPQPAMRHPWMQSGRRRNPPVPERSEQRKIKLDINVWRVHAELGESAGRSRGFRDIKQ